MSRLTWLASVFLIVACLISAYEVLLEALVANIWLCGLIACHCVIHVGLYVLDSHLLWFTPLTVTLPHWLHWSHWLRWRRKGYRCTSTLPPMDMRVDMRSMRWLVIYVILPSVFWLVSLLLGCAESLPESRGIKLSRMKCNWFQLVNKCFVSVFLDVQCSSVTC